MSKQYSLNETLKKKQRGEAQEVFSDLLEISYEATGLPQCVKKKILFLIYLKECVESVFVWKERSS